MRDDDAMAQGEARQLTPETLRGGEWFRPVEPPSGGDGRVAAVVRAAVGLAAAGAIAYLGHPVAAGVVAAIAAGVGATAWASSRARRAIERGVAALGHGVGRLFSVLLLAPAFVLILPIVRGLRRLSGRDPLRLRDGDRPGLWEPADRDDRRLRFVGTSFVTERPRPAPRRWLPVAVGALALILLAELGLRLWGAGEPVLYRSDDDAGYVPAPDQELERFGNRIRTNAWGMRAPDYDAEPPEEAFRILMLGDSTLYGGSYIDQPDLYARRLEERLRERSGAPVQVLNMGVNGWGPFHELGWVERHGSPGASLANITLRRGRTSCSVPTGVAA